MERTTWGATASPALDAVLLARCEGGAATTATCSDAHDSGLLPSSAATRSRPHPGQKRENGGISLPHSQPAERRAVRGGAQHFVELGETPVELDELRATLSHELVVEAVLAEHLENEPAKVAQAVVPNLEQGTSLAAQRAGRGEEDSRRPAASKIHEGRQSCSTTTRSSVISRTAYAGPSRVVPESLTPPYGI